MQRTVQKAIAKLVDALSEFTIGECGRCGGNGMESGTDEHNACGNCGGCGEIIAGGWPDHIREALAAAKEVV